MGNIVMYYVDHFDQRCIGIEYKFLFYPRRCFLSGKLLWLTKAYIRVAMYMGPSDILYEFRYYDKHEYIFYKLREE